MTVHKLPTRASSTLDRIDVADALHDAIAFAEGIMLAALGQANVNGFNGCPMTALIDVHIERLKEIHRMVNPPDPKA